MKLIGRFARCFIGQRQENKDGTDNEDRLSSLPDSLLCEILLNLKTKDVVRSSVLSRRWGHLWRCVPGLDLSCGYLWRCELSLDLSWGYLCVYNTFVSCVDRFLGFNSDLCIEYLKIENHSDNDHVTRWINTVVNRKVKHLEVKDYHWRISEVHIPSKVYTCGTLVTLKLCDVVLPDPKFVFLPCLKVIRLDRVMFDYGLAFQMLISGCPVLESLTLWMNACGNVKCLRVCSKSLLRLIHFGHIGDYTDDKSLVVAIDAPRLRYLKLYDYETPNVIVHNLGSLVKVDIDIVSKPSSRRRFDPNNLPKRNMMRNFLDGISTVEDMVISSSRTLEVIYDYLKCQPLPLFPNLTSMRATDYKWQMLPAFLESFPNLKSLVLESTRYPEKEGISTLSGRPCFLSSLEHVEIQRPSTGLVSYFLENSTLCLDDSRMESEPVILRRPLATPRLSAPRN
ncbi:unnamed protein product [Microthlaspi erraticum]|uniref:F-box domain-containing protein n=1 Tax=Microthlaspi erraticum TaxID=1685480 RepID=A0A6D2L872_9BRAS|nr:unnamed protein product [Microthlaspi erraticum]